MQEALISAFRPLYDSLKQNDGTEYLVTSEDTVGDPLMCVQIYLKSKVFYFLSHSICCILGLERK